MTVVDPDGFGRLAAAFLATRENPNTRAAYARDLGALAEGDIPTLKVRIGVKTRTSAAGTREKVASAIFKWADTTTLTGPVTIVTREKGATGSLATKTANITSNSSLDAGVGYTGNTAFVTVATPVAVHVGEYALVAADNARKRRHAVHSHGVHQPLSAIAPRT